MDAAPPLTTTRSAAPLAEKQTELLLDALKAGLATPGEHRLFRWGKLPGLFPSRTGVAGETATHAVREGYLGMTRTESKGRIVVEWVRVTPAGVAFVHDRDSPKAVLRELRKLLGESVHGVPAWMEQARHDMSIASNRFEERAGQLLAQLESLATRVEDALRRAEAAPYLSESMTQLVPWGLAALEYLDRRSTVGAPGDCPLPELFDALTPDFPDLAVPAYQDGLRRLAEVRAVHLTPAPSDDLVEPEFAFIAEGKLVASVGR